MTKRVIITGVNGFVGEHVTNTFLEDGFEIIGVGYDAAADPKIANLVSEYVQCDLTSEESVKQLDFTDVWAIIHLAGLSSVGDSFKRPREYITQNSLMAFNLLDAAKSHGFLGRAVIVSSGNVYDPNQPLPLTEASKVFSNSPYAVGKLSCEYVSEYFSNQGIRTVVARPFNHIGPGQGPGFLVPDLYFQLKESSEKGFIEVGNIETKRDYTDVRDIARAYKMLALSENLQHRCYNICTGRSLSGSQILQLIQHETNLGDVEIHIDESKIRPTDIMDIYGDSSRLRDELGWSPEIAIDQTISDFVVSTR